MPAAGELRLQVLQERHATPLGGHFGRDKTLALARRSVWWPGLPSAVAEFIQTCPTCQRVKADHLPPAGLLFPRTVPTRRRGSITARSGHDFLQVHIDLLTGRVWLVPTFKTATAETAARNFVGSVFRDVGLPDVPVSDRDTRFTSAFWTGLHKALGSSPIFRVSSPHSHTSKVDLRPVDGLTRMSPENLGAQQARVKHLSRRTDHPSQAINRSFSLSGLRVERVNGVIADVLRSVANECGDDWPEFVPLVEFAINDSASPLGTGYTPFYADRGQHPHRPLTPPAAPDPASPFGDGEAAAQLMGRVTTEMRGAAAGAAGPAQGGA